MPKSILFITLHRPNRSPGQRFRFEQYLPELKEAGFDYEISYLLDENDDRIFYSKGHYLQKLVILLKSIGKRFKDVQRANDFDIIFIYRDAIMHRSILFERLFRKKGVKIIYDFDDAIWLQEVSDANQNLKWLKDPAKTSKIISLADLVFAGNSYLADYALRFNANVEIIPTTIDTGYHCKTGTSDPEKICIGWTGSSTTIKHLKTAVPVLTKLYDKYSGKIKFRIISDDHNNLELPGMEKITWDLEREIKDLSAIDIGIMPLPKDEWSQGKCGFKGLQYMALGIPAVMSPVGVNTEIIEDGINGFLASSDEEWIDKLSQLIESNELRDKLGYAGRKTIEEKYSVNAWRKSYVEQFKNLISY